MTKPTFEFFLNEVNTLLEIKGRSPLIPAEEDFIRMMYESEATPESAEIRLNFIRSFSEDELDEFENSEF